MQKKNTKGITLIALVITIIVLLILAGVSIAMLIGPNGLITKAQEAKTKTEEAGIDEQRNLAMLNATLHPDLWYYKEGGKELTKEEFEKLGLEKDDPERKKYVPIPGGFAPTEIDGEDEVANGFVIIDTDGNEFVWIPCTEEEYNAVDFANATEGTKVEGNPATGLGWTSYYYNDNGRIGTEWKDPEDQVKVAKASINEFGGFYIARYEAGWTGDTTGDYPKDDIKNKSEGTPVSQKGYPAWNFITQGNAISIAGNMVKSDTAQSYLVDSQAWNVICKKIFDEHKKDEKSVLEDSTAWGNYYNSSKSAYDGLNGLWVLHHSGQDDSYQNGPVDLTQVPEGNGINRIELATGLSEKFKAYNIYDMAGNMFEWTTETQAVGTDTVAVFRGGSCNDRGDYDPVVFAYGNTTKDIQTVWIGFRVVLYLKQF